MSKGKKRSGARPGRPQPLRGTKGKRKGARLWYVGGQKEIAGIQSATSRQNTKDQVYSQNEMLAYQQKESTARVASIMENTNLSKQQQVSEIMRQMLTQAQTAGQYFT